MIEFPSFKRLNKVPFYHIVYIPSSVDGHLTRIYVLAVVHKAQMHVEVKKALYHFDFIFFSYISRNEAGGSPGSSFSSFGGASILCSPMAVLMYSPNSSVEEFPLLQALPALFTLFLFHNSHPTSVNLL